MTKYQLLLFRLKDALLFYITPSGNFANGNYFIGATDNIIQNQKNKNRTDPMTIDEIYKYLTDNTDNLPLEVVCCLGIIINSQDIIKFAKPLIIADREPIPEEKLLKA